MNKSLKGTEEQKLFTEWWKFRQEYYEPKTDEEFEILVKRIEEMTNKYVGTELEWLARSMYLLHAEDTERRNGK